MSTSETLIFPHIPKTAGTTVSVTLTGWFKPAEIYHIRSGQHAGAPRFSRHCGPEQTFRALPKQRRLRFRCILGHTKFGLHEAIPGPAKYFTLLRNPLERYLSQVAQYNRMAEHGELGDAEPVSLYEYRRIKPLQFTNPQTRWITGLASREFLKRPDAELLDLAKHNLKAWFRVAGTVEQINDSMAALAACYGKPLPLIQQENASKRRPSIDEFSAAQLQEFQENNQLDEQLWHFAQHRLRSQVAKIHRPSKPMLRQRMFRPFTEAMRRLRVAQQIIVTRLSES